MDQRLEGKSHLVCFTRALRLSKQFHGYPRAGEAIIVLPELDTIDASAVDTSLAVIPTMGTTGQCCPTSFRYSKMGKNLANALA
jgi:hypothetical protein